MNEKGNEIVKKMESMQVHKNIINKVENRLKLLKEKDFKIVLSLSGGAAVGTVGNLATVYFLDKYELMQYIDEVWGVSAGSMVGGAYCAGMDIKEIISIAATVRLRDFIRVSLSMPFETDKLQAFFKEMMPVKIIEECRIPFFALSCNYTEEHQSIDIFKSGSLADAVTASISLPHIFKPFELNGNYYLDGGIVENTPNKSVLKHHKETKDTRRVSILSTCFGKTSLNLFDNNNPIKNLTDTLAYFRYRLQLEQNNYVRSQPGIYQLMLNFEINGITKTQFNKMGPEIAPAYGQLLDKLSYICEKDAWNIDY